MTVYSCTLPFRGSLDNETGLWTIQPDADAYADIMAAVGSGANPAEYNFSYSLQGMEAGQL